MPDTQYIYAGWLIDGSGEPIQKKVLLEIVDGVFTGITNVDNISSLVPELVTDLSHCTILPPLVDSHVHLALSSAVNEHASQKQLEAGYGEIHDLIAQNIHYHFTHGVLAVGDGGDRHGHVLRYRKEHTDANKEPVTMKTAGGAWHQEGPYGNILGKQPGNNETLAHAVARETDQADFVKIINSKPISQEEFGKETRPLFIQDEIRATVQMGEQLGKKVVVHAIGEIPVRQALEAGCNAIEQGYGMGEDNLRYMAKNDTLWIPNVLHARNGLDFSSPGEGVGCRFSTRYVAPGKPVPGAEAFWKKMLAEQLTQLSLARKLGVTTAIGTGAGTVGILHGESMVESAFNVANFFISENIGAWIAWKSPRRLTLSVGLIRQKNSYKDPIVTDLDNDPTTGRDIFGNDVLPDPEAGFVAGVLRTDRVARLEARVDFVFIQDRLSVFLRYLDENRTSNLAFAEFESGAVQLGLRFGWLAPSSGGI